MISVGKTLHFKFKILEKNEMFMAGEVFTKIDQSNSLGGYLLKTQNDNCCIGPFALIVTRVFAFAFDPQMACWPAE